MSFFNMSSIIRAFAIGGALIAYFQSPQQMYAQRPCTNEDARGNYAMQFFGFVNPGTGFVPFAETGELTVINGSGKIEGMGRYSFGGMLVTHSFTGSVTVEANCMARSTITDVNPDGTPGGTLVATWVIIKPGEEIAMTSEAPGGAVNGTLKKIDRR